MAIKRCRFRKYDYEYAKELKAKGYKYVARDNFALDVFAEKPYRDSEADNIWNNAPDTAWNFVEQDYYFQAVKVTDKEPTKLDDIIFEYEEYIRSKQNGKD